ncbi:MAG: hypothetical protein PHQ05_01425 [Sterolibacterium sp.]|nr:hypothetical protein [Sterolibacterium sp.]
MAINFDALASFPSVPTHMVMPTEFAMNLTIVHGICAAIALIYGLRLALINRELIPLLVILGGGVAVLAEPMVDVFGMCYWTENGQWTLFESFGRKIPVIGLFGYIAFFGGATLQFLQQFRNGASYWHVWKLFLIWAVIEGISEPYPISMGVWSYYGAQPFSLFSFPYWWPPVNTVGAYTAAFLIYKLLPYLTGVRQLLIVLAVMTGDIMGNAAVAWPVWSALNSKAGYAATIPAAILTLVLCGIAMHFFAKQAEQKNTP